MTRQGVRMVGFIVAGIALIVQCPFLLQKHQALPVENCKQWHSASPLAPGMTGSGVGIWPWLRLSESSPSFSVEEKWTNCLFFPELLSWEHMTSDSPWTCHTRGSFLQEKSMPLSRAEWGREAEPGWHPGTPKPNSLITVSLNFQCLWGFCLFFVYF